MVNFTRKNIIVKLINYVFSFCGVGGISNVPLSSFSLYLRKSRLRRKYLNYEEKIVNFITITTIPKFYCRQTQTGSVLFDIFLQLRRLRPNTPNIRLWRPNISASPL